MAKKVARKVPLKKISTATTEAGFSLIEILVTIGLLALVTGVFIPSMNSAFREKGEAFTRKIALSLGQARDRAMLTHKLIRLKVDFEKQTLSLHEASPNFLVPKLPDHPPSEREREELEKKEAETFQPLDDLIKSPLELPTSLKVIQVDSPRYDKPQTEGIVAVYLFPNGTTDGATIYFETDEKVHQAITLHPVTGQSRIEAKAPPGGQR